VSLVTDELDRMNRMVNDLILLARAEQPDFLRLGAVEVAEMTHDVFAKAVALGERDWRLGPVATVRVWADRQRLTQALAQLAQNAVQFTGPADQIELSTRVERGRVLLAVRDTGVGIEPADQERIFARFARVERVRAGVDGGAGLGLAIVVAIAEAHHGTVVLDSVPRAGSTFTLVLPLDQAARP
jgi:signal transduction histidine kinase